MAKVSAPVVIPTILSKALAGDPVAKDYFNSLPPSHKREYIGYIIEAKKPETQARRVHKTVAMLRAEARIKAKSLAIHPIRPI